VFQNRFDEVEEWYFKYLDHYPHTYAVSTPFAFYEQSVIAKLGGKEQIALSQEKKNIFKGKMDYLISRYGTNAVLKAIVKKRLEENK
jgi:hypothetical protein